MIDAILMEVAGLVAEHWARVAGGTDDAKSMARLTKGVERLGDGGTLRQVFAMERSRLMTRKYEIDQRAWQPMRFQHEYDALAKLRKSYSVDSELFRSVAWYMVQIGAVSSVGL